MAAEGGQDGGAGCDWCFLEGCGVGAAVDDSVEDWGRHLRVV